jgi:hypothetical protein
MSSNEYLGYWIIRENGNGHGPRYRLVFDYPEYNIARVLMRTNGSSICSGQIAGPDYNAKKKVIRSTVRRALKSGCIDYNLMAEKLRT